MNNRIEELFLTREHQTKQEQVDASVRFVLQDNKAYYNALGSLPSRVKESLMTIIIDWPEASGYHFNVLRAAQKQYSRGAGFIDMTELPFTTEELA
jgi:hypothetical protein